MSDELILALIRERDALHARVAVLEAQLGLVSDETLDELGRYRSALKKIAHITDKRKSTSADINVIAHEALKG